MEAAITWSLEDADVAPAEVVLDTAHSGYGLPESANYGARVVLGRHLEALARTLGLAARGNIAEFVRCQDTLRLESCRMLKGRLGLVLSAPDVDPGSGTAQIFVREVRDSELSGNHTRVVELRLVRSHGRWAVEHATVWATGHMRPPSPPPLDTL